ncbi:MAG: DnaD domain protein [Clostridia bacterium]|nr:DnaD domain protein [Clostridia bacterium]
MSFCSFSKECDDNAYTLVENKFIHKYLPEADGFAVKVYLYGLYLCKNASDDFTVTAMAEVLKSTPQKIKEAFAFWEDYDLVQILSHEPFAVSYLPVRSSVGRPKRVRYEQYADFNKELQRKMQKVGKFVGYNDSLKYMQFLEDTEMQPQAFLLIAEYCITKQGDAVSPAYIFNKAKKYIRNGWTTYEQVERELNNCNANEKEVLSIFGVLNISRTPDETDYALYQKWLDLGLEPKGIFVASKLLKRGGMTALNLSIEELAEKSKFTEKEIVAYLEEREKLVSITFRIGRKLGVKIGNPATFTDEYTEKWLSYGFEDSSLLDVALFCLKTERGDFSQMNEIIEQLFANGVVSKESVKEYLKGKNDGLKLYAKIREISGAVAKNAVGLSMIETWRKWNFSDEIILEAAKRSAGTTSPIPYINKILSDWKLAGVTNVDSIPNAVPMSATKPKNDYTTAIENVNAKTDREHYYAIKRERAQSVADKFLKKANANAKFKEVNVALSKMEITLAKAEVFEPNKLPALETEKQELIKTRFAILKELGIKDEDLKPQYECKKCSDTGFLPNGTACNCYDKV